MFIYATDFEVVNESMVEMYLDETVSNLGLECEHIVTEATLGQNLMALWEKIKEGIRSFIERVASWFSKKEQDITAVSTKVQSLGATVKVKKDILSAFKEMFSKFGKIESSVHQFGKEIGEDIVATIDESGKISFESFISIALESASRDAKRARMRKEKIKNMKDDLTEIKQTFEKKCEAAGNEVQEVPVTQFLTVIKASTPMISKYRTSMTQMLAIVKKSEKIGDEHAKKGSNKFIKVVSWCISQLSAFFSMIGMLFVCLFSWVPKVFAGNKSSTALTVVN